MVGLSLSEELGVLAKPCQGRPWEPQVARAGLPEVSKHRGLEDAGQDADRRKGVLGSLFLG